MNDDGVSVAFDLILEELERVVSDVNAQGAASMRNGDYAEAETAIASGRRLAQFRDKLQVLVNEWDTVLDEPVRSQISVETSELRRTIASVSKSPKTVLLVRFADGTLISERLAADTFVATIKKLGAQRVERLGMTVNRLPLLSTIKSDTYSQARLDGYWVMTHSSTEYKRQLLHDISSQLGELLAVDIVPATQK